MAKRRTKIGEKKRKKQQEQRAFSFHGAKWQPQLPEASLLLGPGMRWDRFSSTSHTGKQMFHEPPAMTRQLEEREKRKRERVDWLPAWARPLEGAVVSWFIWPAIRGKTVHTSHSLRERGREGRKMNWNYSKRLMCRQTSEYVKQMTIVLHTSWR